MAMAGYRCGEISFDSPRDIFYAGQVLTGKVTFVIEQPYSLTALTVQFLGEASVGWTEEESETAHGVKRYREVEYVGVEEYFNDTQLLAGGNSPVNLTAGTHTYQFSYMIPPSVPSSFDKDERGRIKYGAKATIELRGHGYMKEEYAKFFDVVAPFDLNLGNERVREPIELDFEESYSGCFCGAGAVLVKLKLPVSAYCPGQIIPVSLQADNRSNVEITNIILQIITRRRYRSQRPISEYIPPDEVLVSVKKGSIMSNTKRNHTIDLQVPEIIAPNLEGCGIIDVGYFFRAIIKMSGCNEDMEDEAEICLGLVPLTQTLDGPYTHPLNNDLPLGPIPDIRAIQANLDEQNRQQELNNMNNPITMQNNPINLQNNPITMPNNPIALQNNPINFQNSSHYSVQVQQQFISSDPTKNYQIGFKIDQPGQNWPPPFPQSDLRVNLPPISMNTLAPSAPPPST